MISQLSSQSSPYGASSLYQPPANSGALALPNNSSSDSSGDVIVNPIYLPPGSSSSPGQTAGTTNRPTTNTPSPQQPQQQPVYQPPKPQEPSIFSKLIRAFSVIVQTLGQILPYQQTSKLYETNNKVMALANGLTQLGNIFNPQGRASGGGYYAQATDSGTQASAPQQALASPDPTETPVTADEAAGVIARKYGPRANTIFQQPNVQAFLRHWPAAPREQRAAQERLIDLVAARLEGQPQSVATANNAGSTASTDSDVTPDISSKPRKTRADILLEQQAALASIGGKNTFTSTGPSFS